MLLPLSAAAIVLVALLWEMAFERVRTRLRLRRGRPAHTSESIDYDPGRERRAEQRAQALLKTCVNEEEWAMYRDLGFVRVWGRLGAQGARASRGKTGAPYAYLIYPHKPVVAYLPQTSVLLNEYCVEFPDHSRPYGSARLPDSDDVLAKWMALTGDEERLISSANMHLPGRQIDPEQVRKDLIRLTRWERERLQRMRRRAAGAQARARPQRADPGEGRVR